MWRITVLAYQAIHSALLPVRLHELPRFVDVFLEHVGRRNEHKRQKQTEYFFKQCEPSPHPPAPADGPGSPRAPPEAA